MRYASFTYILYTNMMHILCGSGCIQEASRVCAWVLYICGKCAQAYYVYDDCTYSNFVNRPIIAAECCCIMSFHCNSQHHLVVSCVISCNGVAHILLY